MVWEGVWCGRGCGVGREGGVIEMEGERRREHIAGHNKITRNLFSYFF